MPVLPLPRPMKAVLLIGAHSVLLLTTGCWEETDVFPTPTPTPTPFPTPTVTPFPTPTPTPTLTPFSSRSSAKAGDVVLNNANIVEAAALDAVAGLIAVENIFAAEPIDSSKLSTASASLANAREAFFVVETSLYYTDYADEAELAALPPTLTTTLPDLRLPGFDDLREAIAAHSAGTGIVSDADLRSMARSLREDLETLAASWNPDALGNFRNGIFLSDPNATGRICQGIATMTDILVLSSLKPDNAQILQRLWATKYLLEGSYESASGSDTQGNGLLDLVSSKDAPLAKSIRSDLNRIIGEYEGSGVPSGDAASTFEQLHDAIRSMTELLGYELAPVSP